MLLIYLIILFFSYFIYNQKNIILSNSSKNLIYILNNYSNFILRQNYSNCFHENKVNDNFINKDYFATLTIKKVGIYDIKIKDGVDYNTMLFYIGHFKNTPKIYGNICLIAHNRGFMLNYFEKLKFLKIDDEICYMINNKNIIYKVTFIKIINSNDFTYIKNTNDDNLTLITCVENQKDKRLCIRCRKVREE